MRTLKVENIAMIQNDQGGYGHNSANDADYDILEKGDDPAWPGNIKLYDGEEVDHFAENDLGDDDGIFNAAVTGRCDAGRSDSWCVIG
mmetsp:Transcript_45675/g.95857  ORF Transcript_45675/g.95857 Transcript_45675/m.95857 type:complete len:88 (-) Transcript_45675:111-374(-)